MYIFAYHLISIYNSYTIFYTIYRFSCVWLLQKPLYNSGEFRYTRYSPIKHESENGTNYEWDFDLMHAVNIKDETVLTKHLKAITPVNNGDVYCFEGNITMHETTQIVGDVDRVIFVTAYSEINNFQHTGNVNENNKWGKHNNKKKSEL